MLDVQESRPLHDAVSLAIHNCYAQRYDIDVGIPFLLGSPGIGKTSSIKNIAEEYKNKSNIAVVSTHIALKPLEEFGGIPKFVTVFVNNEKKYGTVWSIPEVVTLLNKIQSEGNYDMIIWLLDDAHLMTTQHMELLYELFTERSIRGHKIPDICGIIMAGNNSAKTGTKPMFSAIVNRCVLMPVYPDFNNWKYNFAIKNQVHSTILAFLSNKQYQNSFFLQEEQSSSAWASPRSWTRLSNEISIREKWFGKQPSVEDIAYLSAGYIGKEAANYFTTFYSVYSKIVKNLSITSKIEEIPEDVSERFSIAFGLVNDYFTQLDSQKRYNNRDTLLSHMTRHIETFIRHGHTELAIMMIKDINYGEKSLDMKFKYTPGRVIFSNITDVQIRNKIINDIRSVVEEDNQ